MDGFLAIRLLARMLLAVRGGGKKREKGQTYVFAMARWGAHTLQRIWHRTTRGPVTVDQRSNTAPQLE